MSYGLQVWASNGSRVVLTNTSIVANFITTKISGTPANSITLAASATSSAISCEGMTATNDNEIFVVTYTPGSSFISYNPVVTRSTGSFTIKNPIAFQLTFSWLAGRYT